MRDQLAAILREMDELRAQMARRVASATASPSQLRWASPPAADPPPVAIATAIGATPMSVFSNQAFEQDEASESASSRLSSPPGSLQATPLWPFSNQVRGAASCCGEESFCFDLLFEACYAAWVSTASSFEFLQACRTTLRIWFGLDTGQ